MTEPQTNAQVPATAVETAPSAALLSAFQAFRASSGELQTAYARLETEARELRERLDRQEAARDNPARTARTPAGARRLRSVLDALPAAIIIVDSRHVIVDSNRTALDWFGAGLQGRAWPDVLASLADDVIGQRGEVRLRDGRRLNVERRELSTAPDLTPGDAVLLVTDVTRDRQLDDVITRHRRLAALGEMAATLAHQIRTPLSAALLYASNAANSALAAGRRDELLGRTIACLNDLEGLVSDMLAFARGADPSIAPTTVDLAEVLTAVERTGQTLLRKDQTLLVRPAEDLPQVPGNRESLAGAVLNLVANALQAAGDSARIEVIAVATTTGAEIRVSDNGPGVSEAVRERIFEPFYTTRTNGNGLGLAVVRSVAQSYGGSVRFEPNDPSGSTFVISLPVATRVNALLSAMLRRSSSGALEELPA